MIDKISYNILLDNIYNQIWWGDREYFLSDFLLTSVWYNWNSAVWIHRTRCGSNFEFIFLDFTWDHFSILVTFLLEVHFQYSCSLCPQPTKMFLGKKIFQSSWTIQFCGTKYPLWYYFCPEYCWLLLYSNRAKKKKNPKKPQSKKNKQSSPPKKTIQKKTQKKKKEKKRHPPKKPETKQKTTHRSPMFTRVIQVF